MPAAPDWSAASRAAGVSYDCQRTDGLAGLREATWTSEEMRGERGVGEEGRREEMREEERRGEERR